MISVSISVDVPDLERGIGFYESALGFTKVSQPVPGVAVLRAGNVELCVLEKRAGSQPAPGASGMRHYDRHWTPVHLDFHVDDLKAALAKALGAGAVQEQFFANPEHGSVAFCSDPFGHGFCLIERKQA
jgi:predicted enzyme related to lactoylglutathione lyase